MPEDVSRKEALAAGSEIRCDDLSISFRADADSWWSRWTGRPPRLVCAVRHLDVRCPAGKIIAILGKSGCGKTTLLRAMAGLQDPTSGSVSLHPPCRADDGQISFVFQHPSLLPWRTASQNVRLPLELIGDGRAAADDDRVTAALDQVELSGAASRRPHELSGGMQMRVSIARALVTRPSVLLLDEPFAALDDMLRSQLGELVRNLWRDAQFTAVLVTHNIAEAILMSHRIVVMTEGRNAVTLENPMTWPRSDRQRRTAEFAEFYGQVDDVLRGTAKVTTARDKTSAHDDLAEVVR